MDVDERLDSFAARLSTGVGSWSLWDPLTTDEQREVIRLAREARRELRAERERATRLAAKAQELQGELDLLRRE